MKIKTLLLFCFAYHFFALGQTDTYIIKYNKENPKLVSVKASITLSDSLLYMTHYGTAPEKWSNYIDNLTITTETGSSISFEKNDPRKWILKDVEKNTTINLNYTLRVDHENEKWPGGIDGVAFARDWGVMTSGRSIFIMNGKKKDYIVQFDKPNAWKVSATWKKVENKEDTYQVPNRIKLHESYLFAGTHKEINLKRDQFNLRFVLGGNSILEDESNFVKRASALLDYYINLMGGVPKPTPDDDLSNVLVMINQGDQIDGEVIGNHISMFMNPKADMQSQLTGWFVFAHEFFHLWNGKTLRFNDTSAEWFKEGVSNYYTIKALNHIGFIEENGTKMVLNNLFYTKYVNDSGYLKLAPADAASGFDKDNHWGLIYGGGLFAGICMDMEIRNNTENSNSLDDAMRYFYQEYGGKKKLISNEAILEQVNYLSKTDFTEFLNRYIKGTEAVPLGDYLKYAGVKVDTSNKQLELNSIANKSDLQKDIWNGFFGN